MAICASCSGGGGGSAPSNLSGEVGVALIPLRYIGKRLGATSYRIHGRTYLAGQRTNDGIVEVWDIDVANLMAQYPNEFQQILQPPVADVEPTPGIVVHSVPIADILVDPEVAP